MDMRTTGDFTPYDATTVNLRCPICRHVGAFHGARTPDVTSPIMLQVQGRWTNLGTRKFGIRVCPNSECRAVVFFATDSATKETIFFPPEVIDFDATNLPQAILSSLEEAVKCHAAGCFRAAALMIRRTLEELCDEKQAGGANLKARIQSLSAIALIPADLLSAADELRLLGNDAAHIEAKDYNKIGKNESELAIELTKELLKAVYQYTSLVARLTALKNQPTA